MNIFKYVCATFYQNELTEMIFCSICFWDERTEKWVKTTLADRSHQALIETLEVTWPNWTDADQQLARSE